MSVCNCAKHLLQVFWVDTDPIGNRIRFLPANGLVNNEEITDFPTYTGGMKKGLIRRHHRQVEMSGYHPKYCR